MNLGDYDGLYIAKFTSLADPTVNGGVVVLRQGHLRGGDSGYFYVGTYHIEQDDIAGRVTITQHDENILNVFGDGAETFNVSLRLSIREDGLVVGSMAREGLVEQRVPVGLRKVADL